MSEKEKMFFVWIRNALGCVEPQIYYNRVARGKWGDPNKILQTHELSEDEKYRLMYEHSKVDILAERYPYHGE